MRPAVGLVCGALLAGCSSAPASPSPVAAPAAPPASDASPRGVADDVSADRRAATPTPPTTGSSPDAPNSTTTTATTPAAAPSTIATTTERRWPRTVTMAFTGDTLPHSPLWRRAASNAEASGRGDHDFRPMLADLVPLMAGVDLAVCHLETPIAPAGEEHSTSPYYGVPLGIADAIAATGFDRCSTASNHVLDRGVAGIDRTVEALASRGVAQTGMARYPGEIEPAVVDVGGVGVAHLAYTWSYNGLTPPPGEEWRSALIDVDRIVADARAARAARAALVVVSLHWGEEGRHEPTPFQRRVAEELTATGTIDLIVGHHAHVVQPIEQVNGRWVLFGLGNILSNLPTSPRWPAATQDAVVAVVEATVHADGDVDVGPPTVHPTWVDHDAGWAVRVVADQLARDDLTDGARARLEESLVRTAAVLGDHLAPAARRAAEHLPDR